MNRYPRYSIRIGFSDYRRILGVPGITVMGGSLNPFMYRILFSFQLVRRYFNRFEGFRVPDDQEMIRNEYSYEAVIRLRWIWFIMMFPFVTVFNFFEYAWKGGLSQYPRISRVVSVDRIFNYRKEFRGLDELWNSMAMKEDI